MGEAGFLSEPSTRAARVISRVVVAAIGLALVLVSLPGATAQEGPVIVTSLEPLQRILDGLAAGEDLGSLQRAGSGGEATIVGQVQFAVNLGSGGTFGESGFEFPAVGLPPDGGLDFLSLDDKLGGVIGERTGFPPLDPWSAAEGPTNIAPIIDGWNAYGGSGPIDGPVEILEAPTLVWGVELAEPFDETCGSAAFVGRSWMGESITSDEPPFTADALAQWFPGTHDSLVGDERSQLIQLRCQEGGEPVIQRYRMTPDLGVRPVTPVKSVALVNGNHVLFFSPMRILDGRLDPFVYATPLGGGPVDVAQSNADIPALVPNPYDEYTFLFELIELSDDASTGIAPPGVQGRTLALAGNPQINLVLSPGCPHGYVRGHVRCPECEAREAQGTFFTPEAIFQIFSTARSTVASGQVSADGELAATSVTPTGNEEVLALDTNTGEGTVDSLTIAGAPCTVIVLASVVETIDREPGDDPSATDNEPGTTGDAPPAAGDEGDDAGSNSTVLYLMLGVAVAAGLTYLFRGFLFGRERVPAEVPDEEPPQILDDDPIEPDDLGSEPEPTPSDPGVVFPGTPEPSVPDDEPLHNESCDWSVYYETAGGQVPIKVAKRFECCKYVLKIETDVWIRDRALKGRQDARSGAVEGASPDERLRLLGGAASGSGASVYAWSSVRTGPAGRQDWMQGLGDPRPTGDGFPPGPDAPFDQDQTLEEPLDAAVFVRQAEDTTVIVTRESNCASVAYRMGGEAKSELQLVSGHECTNRDHDPECPVEFNAAGFARVNARGQLRYEQELKAAADVDELDGDQPSLGHALTDSHDHEMRARGSYSDRAEASDTAAGQLNRFEATFSTTVAMQSGVIVPVEVWPSTERVTADNDGRVVTYAKVNAHKDPMQEGCCVGRNCWCRPSWHVEIDGDHAEVVVGEARKSLHRPQAGGYWT